MSPWTDSRWARTQKRYGDDGAWLCGHALVIQTLPLRTHHWLRTLHCLPAPAPTCCAPIRNVGPVGEPSQRQGDMSSCGSSAGPSQRKLSFARFVLHAANSTASGLCDDGIHKPSACAGNELWGCCTFGVVLLGGTGSARQPCARICALPYPLIDCDTYPSPHPSHRGLSHVCGE